MFHLALLLYFAGWFLVRLGFLAGFFPLILGFLDICLVLQGAFLWPRYEIPPLGNFPFFHPVVPNGEAMGITIEQL